MDAMNYVNESYNDLISTERVESIRDGSQYHPSVNIIEDWYKICDCIRQMHSEWNGMSEAIQNMSKGSHKVFKTVVKDISEVFPPLGESGSEFSYFIPESRKFAEVTTLSDDIKKPWLKATLKYINN